MKVNWFITGFLLLGFLVGNLAGLSSAQLTTTLLGLLFAVAGGSLLVFFEKLTPDGRQQVGKALAGLSIACLLGIYCGIVVSEHQLLTPRQRGPEAAASSAVTTRPSARPERFAYLRSQLLDESGLIDRKYGNGEIDAAEAYRKLLELVRRRAPDENDNDRN